MSNTGYETHIKGNNVFWCNMTDEQRKEYSDDNFTPVPKDWTPCPLKVHYPSNKVGGVSVDSEGNIMGWHSERDRRFAHAIGE
jgi:hypothetical protein